MHKSSHMDHKIEVVLFDKANPRALCNVLPEPVFRQVQNLYNSEDSYLIGLSDSELIREAKLRGKIYGTLDFNLRARFWGEYGRFLTENDHRGHMSMPYVLGRRIPKETFYKHYITDPLKLAWLLKPTIPYEEQIDAVLCLVMSKLLEMLE